MNIILSIKPRWAEKIYNGEKVIEFRKTIPKSLIRLDTFENKIHPISRKESYPGKIIFIYESMEVKKITGYCKFKDLIFERIFFDDSGKVIVPRSYPFGREGFTEWLFYAGGGIKEKELSKYAGEKKFVWCWKIIEPRRLYIPAELKEFDLHRPPQSFCYTNYGLNSEGNITLYGVDFAS